MSLKNKATILLDTLILIDNYAISGSFLKTSLNHDSENKVTIKSIDICYTFNNRLHNKITLDSYKN